MGEQNAVTTRQAQIVKLTQMKRDSIARRRARAKVKKNDQILWETDFDSERMWRGGGLIDVCEVKPFVDCQTAEEYLHTSRIFANALRKSGIDLPEIMPSETLNDFILRVHKAWYSSASLGQIFHFVCLNSSEFDDDLGFRRSTPYNWSTWIPVPGSEIALTAEEIAALPKVGKSDPEWKQAGFDSYADWKEQKDEEERKQKRRSELEASLRSAEEINRDLNSQANETKVPTLLYQAILSEN